MDLQWMMSAIMVSMIDDLCWCHTWTTQYYLTSTATRDGWRQHIDMITTQPQLSSQLLCRCCPGWAGLRLLPGVAQQLAACPCTGDVSVRGDTWVSWGHCIMSKQCHNTGHCYDGKYGHVTCSIWSQGRTPGSPRPSHTWHQHTTHEMTHDSSTHQLECKLRLPSNTMISFPNDHHQYTK